MARVMRYAERRGESVRPNECLAAPMSKRLLILMDDEPTTTRALALDLADAGYRVDTAFGFEEALRKTRTVAFDLVIAGEQRGSTARGFVDRFRRLRPEAKVVLMTTGEPPSGVRLDEAGARVGKPFDLDDFRSLVGRLVGREGKASEA